jgi:hypothetical protein
MFILRKYHYQLSTGRIAINVTQNFFGQNTEVIVWLFL